MTADKPSSLVPKLRFPEFQSRPAWQYTSLCYVLQEHGLKSDGTSEVHSVSLGKGIVPQVEHMGRSYAANDTAHYSLVRPFDVVYTRSPLSAFPLGIVKQHKSCTNAIVSPLYGVFEPRNRHLGRIIEAYFDSSLRNIRFLDPLAQKGAKNTIQLSNDRFLSGALYLPEDEDEQKKIADCLGSLDDLIAEKERKLEALRQYKLGLLQQFFPQPGESVPRLRFPESRDASLWNKKPVRELAHVIAGQSPSGENYNTVGNGVPFYQGKAEFGVTYLKNPTKWTTQVTKLTQPGDILMSVRAPVGALNVSKEQICIGRGLAGLQARCDKWFLYYSLLSQQGRIVGNGGSVFDSIKKKQIEEMLILVPPTVTEQRKIADCLGALDDLIATEGRKLESLWQHKQGLMQQLSPSPAAK